jgi:hypothetical protein
LLRRGGCIGIVGNGGVGLCLCGAGGRDSEGNGS